MYYNFDIHKKALELRENGYCYLPPIKDLILDLDTVNKVRNDVHTRSYQTGLACQEELVGAMGLRGLLTEFYNSYLKKEYPNLHPNDEYFVCRTVSPNQKSEAYRGHFDGHLITVVLPILIPNKTTTKCGELKFVPKARKASNFELINFFQKALWKRYANSEGFSKIAKKHVVITENFHDYRPLVFVGRTTFHGNNILDKDNHQRISFLCHAYDPSPRYGISSILRKLRNR